MKKDYVFFIIIFVLGILGMVFKDVQAGISFIISWLFLYAIVKGISFFISKIRAKKA